MNSPSKPFRRAEYRNGILIVLLFAAACFAVSMLGGCTTSPVNPGAIYVAQDRATYTAVAPILNMTATDHPAMKPAIDDKVAAWDARLKAAEAANAPAPQQEDHSHPPPLDHP